METHEFMIAFTKWYFIIDFTPQKLTIYIYIRVNNKLDVKNIPNIVHLNEDLANGVRLIQLLVIE